MKPACFLAKRSRRNVTAIITAALLTVFMLQTLALGDRRAARGGKAIQTQATKEEMSARLNELDATIGALRNLLAEHPGDMGLQSHLDASLLEYESLSALMGGDRAAPIGVPTPEDLVFLNSVPTSPANCTPTTTNFANNTPLAIPTGPAVVSNTIVVSGVGPFLWDLDLTTNLTHTFSADLDITLMSPAGTVVTLTTDNGAGNDNNFNGTLWDDDANPAGQVPYTTNNGMATDHAYVNLTTATPLVPEEAMAAFIGEDPNGTWTITISDDLAGDGGSLTWSIDVTTFPSAPTNTTASFSNNTPVAIPTGPAVVTSTIVVSGAGTTLCDVNVTTALSHTFAADLDVTVMSPAGTVVTLTTDNGAGNDDVFNGTVWDDDANPAGQVPYVTNSGLVTDHPYVNLTLASPLVPEEALGAFIGEDPNGTWTITISDDLAGTDGGTLSSWSLDITTCTCAVACTITCPANITVSNDPNQCGAIVNYPAPMTTGSCGTVTCSPPSGSFFPVGSTPVNCTTTAGPSCSFTVTVNDTQPPSITCPPNISATVASPGASCGVVNFPTPTPSDNCPGVMVACTPPSGTCFPAGTTTVTCTATDTAGNTATCSFTVNLTIFNICIQDNFTRRFFRFSSTTGDFVFIDCSKGITATGKGTVATNFCKITLNGGASGKTSSSSVSALANTCTGAASATIVVNGVTHTLNDSNMANSACGCP
jgi:subtilisin-like proprotein convertase family protein